MEAGGTSKYHVVFEEWHADPEVDRARTIVGLTEYMALIGDTRELWTLDLRPHGC